MTRARRLWLWVHRWLGLLLAGWFGLLGLTGSLLVFYPSMEPWFDARIAPRPAAQPVSIERVAQTLSQAHPARTGGWRIELPTAGNAVVTARYLKPVESTGKGFAPLLVSVDGVRGEVLASRFWGDTAMTWVYDLHYMLLLDAPGRIAVAVAGLLMLLSIASGLWLWWPRHGAWRAALAFKRDASIQRRVYDLHKWGGLIAVPLLSVLALTGAVLGWPAVSDPVIGWFSPLSTPPAPRSAPPARPRLNADAVLHRVHQAWPDAEPRWIDVPGDDPTAPFRIRLRLPGDPGDRFPSSVAWLDAHSGEVLALRSPDSFSSGDVFRQWMHPLHSGEAFGLAGRWLVCAAGLLPLLLGVTGVWRWWHKRRGNRVRTRCATHRHGPTMA